MSSNGYTDILEDTARSKESVRPDILTNVYGNLPPKASVFDGGVSDRAGVEEATAARREVLPGAYDDKRD